MGVMELGLGWPVEGVVVSACLFTPRRAWGGREKETHRRLILPHFYESSKHFQKELSVSQVTDLAKTQLKTAYKATKVFFFFF